MPKTIPEAVITSIKSNTSFLSLLKSYNVPVTKRGQSHFAICPFHDIEGKPEKTPSLSIDTIRNLYHCFSCDAKGNIIQFVEQMEHIGFKQAVEKLLALTPLVMDNKNETPPTQPIPQQERDTLLEHSFKQMVDTYTKHPEGKTYLESKRGIRTEGLEIGYCRKDFASRITLEQKKAMMDMGLITATGKPHFSGCVVFPLRDITGKLAGLYGRKINSTGTHYYLKGERSGVYSLHNNNSDTVFIVESIIDALSLYCIGINSVLALHGVNGFTPAHEQWLKTKGISTIYLLLDGDSSGREAAQRLSLQLKEKKYTTHIFELPDNEDPNSFFSFAAHTLEDLKQLPGYPRQKKEILALHRNGEALVVTGTTCVYTVQGLVGYGLDRLRVTIKASLLNKPSAFYIDNIDLYNARARNNFVEGLSAQLSCNTDQCTSEVNQLITLLEKERLHMREHRNEPEQYVMSEQEKEEALTALKSHSLINDIIEDFSVLGMIGEEKAKLLCYLGTISRLLPHPLGILIISRSGAGKTMLQDAACSFVPVESLVKYTRLTGQALFYKDTESLKHKTLAIEEEEGMQQAIYAIRTLQSSQCLRVATTRSDPKTGKLKTEEYTVEGPVFIFIATTNPDALDNETKNRFIILTIDESHAQTKKIMDKFKHSFTLQGKLESRDKESVIQKHQNMQRLLKPIEVVNNYAPYLDYAFDRLQMRREVRKYMTLIESITLLRQYQKRVKHYTKEGKEHRYIEVDVEDIAVANDLVMDFFKNSIDELAPHTRNLAKEIVNLIKHKEGESTFTRKELRDLSGWSDWSVRQGLAQLENLGYIIRRSGSNGVQIIYELIIDPTVEKRGNLLLTSTEELKKQLKSAAKRKKRNGVKSLSPSQELVNLVATL